MRVGERRACFGGRDQKNGQEITLAQGSNRAVKKNRGGVRQKKIKIREGRAGRRGREVGKV